MSQKIKDGGPAFPPVHDPKTHASGMTLRDYFAAQVIGHLVISPLRQELTIDKDVAYAYTVADAMLRAREAA